MTLTTRLEHSGSAGPTTLVAEVTAGGTNLVLADATGFPTGGVGPFVLTLDRGTTSEERMLCTSRTGNSVTVSDRGWDGSVARGHIVGATVEHTWSQTEADQANAHSSAAAGVHGVAGSVVGTTDTQTLTNKTLTSPVISDFTNAGHDHGDADDGGGNIPQASVTGLVTALAGKDTALANHEADNTAVHGVVAVVGTTETQTLTNKTLTSPVLTTPTIASFSNAQHTHSISGSDGGLVSLAREMSTTFTARDLSSGSAGPKDLAEITIAQGTYLVIATLRGFTTNGSNGTRLRFFLDSTTGDFGGVQPSYAVSWSGSGVGGGVCLSGLFSVNGFATSFVTMRAEWLSGSDTATTSTFGHLVAVRIGPDSNV